MLYYPHVPIGKVWIYIGYCLFVFCLFCLCVFVRLRIISPPTLKLAASNLLGGIIGIQGRESHILGNYMYASSEAQNRVNRPACEPRAVGPRAGHLARACPRAWPARRDLTVGIPDWNPETLTSQLPYIT